MNDISLLIEMSDDEFESSLDPMLVLRSMSPILRTDDGYDVINPFSDQRLKGGVRKRNQRTEGEEHVVKDENKGTKIYK